MLTYATRRSPLALAQCRAFVEKLLAAYPGLEVRELQVVTTGDRILHTPLTEIGGKRLFVKEIEEALLDGRADFAVHSMKDLPIELPTGLAVACVPARADPRDVIVAPRHGTLDVLPRGARVGSSSLRRMVSLRAIRPDIAVVQARGNVDTRLRKVDAGEYDAIVIAQAGLVRLGLEQRATSILPLDVSLPAVGQGALAIECRESDLGTRELLSALHDAQTATSVAAERGVLAAVGGDCRTPLGAHAQREQADMHLRAFVADPDGSRMRRKERRVEWPSSEAGAHDLGFELGKELLALETA
jgi:hydroxymethylbilane synthase